MRFALLLRAGLALCLASGVCRVNAQSATGAGGAAASGSAGGRSVAASNSPSNPIKFSDEKPVWGLPVDASRSRTQCASDGVTFFGVSSVAGTAEAGSTSAADLYGVTLDGELKHLQRKLPIDAASVFVRDFFAADHTLVTLLEADGSPGDDSATAARNVRYLLSLSEHDGDDAKLVPLDVKFTPRKVALFGSGDFLVLGWDELNLLPVLALVKDDGTVRKFLEIENGRAPHFRDGPVIADAPSRIKLTAALVQHAAFVPFDSQVLLTFPGTREALRVWSAVGEDWSLPMGLPSDTVLHDVLTSGGRGTLVLRAETVPSAEVKAADGPPPLRLFQMNSYRGGVKELFVDKPRAEDMVCGVNGKLTALFLDSLPDASAEPAGADGKPDQSPVQRLVIATAPRPRS